MAERISFEQLEIAKEVVVAAFDREIQRITSGENETRIKTFFLQLYFEERLHTFFIPKNLQSLAEGIFTDVNVRDFVLNFSDGVALMLAVSDFPVDRLINTIAYGMTLNKKPVETGKPSLCLIQENLRASIEVREENLVNLLEDNFWLVCLILLYQFLTQTQTYTASLDSVVGVKSLANPKT